MKIEYVVIDNWNTYPDDTFELPGDHPEVTHSVVSDCGNDYYHHHDGWECSWPLMFGVYADGELAGTYEVDQEAVPVFIVTEVKGK